MESRAERVKNFAKIFSESRYDAGVSQEYMALELGVSRKTIQNWESGISSPNYFQQLEWFRILNLSQTPYLYKYVNSDVRNNNTMTKEEKFEISFNNLMKELNISQKRCITYLLTGTYQGDPQAMLQLFVAHAHLPMHYRYAIANMICETYKICDKTNMLSDTDYILPNISVLEEAIEAGKQAALNGHKGYVVNKDWKE